MANKKLIIDTLPINHSNWILREAVTPTGEKIPTAVGLLQCADKINKNRRKYPKKVLSREIDRYIEEFVKMNNAYGELDHPDSTIVAMQTASHIIRKIWWEGNLVKGELELLDSPNGHIVEGVMRRKYNIGISSRGAGSVEPLHEEQAVEVQDDFELVAWDFVSNPSTHFAFMNLKENKRVQIEAPYKYANSNKILNNIFKLI